MMLCRCTSKGEEDYRPLFENFVYDLLSTVNKPDWPAAELILSLLGNLLVMTTFLQLQTVPPVVSHDVVVLTACFSIADCCTLSFIKLFFVNYFMVDF